MKKLAIASALIASMTALVACEDASVEASQEQRMTLVESTSYGDILCDNRTGVFYFVYNECYAGYGGSGIGHGGICVMVDQNGKPLVMEEDE